jgi:hypothetical protein
VQIHTECGKFTKVTNIRSACVYGGAGVKHQIGDLKRGAEIVVCTPGRMIDVLCANKGRVTNLKRVTFLVLDVGDRMFDMGFVWLYASFIPSFFFFFFLLFSLSFVYLFFYLFIYFLLFSLSNVLLIVRNPKSCVSSRTSVRTGRLCSSPRPSRGPSRLQRARFSSSPSKFLLGMVCSIRFIYIRYLIL